MSRRVLHSAAAIAVLVVGLVWVSPLVLGQDGGKPSTANGEWPHYAADQQSTRYSPLAQIDASNFNDLEVAWRFRTDNFGPAPEYKLEGTQPVTLSEGPSLPLPHMTSYLDTWTRRAGRGRTKWLG